MESYWELTDIRRRKCPEESDFEDMYEALGDRETQARIRDKNPKGLHCDMLTQSPNACDGCKNNPYNESHRSVNRDIVDDNEESLSRLIMLERYARLGLLNLEDLSVEEAFLLSVYSERKWLLNESVKAEIIASKLAEILIPLFKAMVGGSHR